MLSLMLVGTVTLAGPSDRIVTNIELERQVRRTMPRYRSDWDVVVSDDGGSVFCKGLELNRFSATGPANNVGERIQFTRVGPIDMAITVSQGGHISGNWANGKHDQAQLVCADDWSSVYVSYQTDRGDFLTSLDMGRRGKQPNRSWQIPYLWLATRDAQNRDTLWGFRSVGQTQYLQSASIKSGKRLTSSKVPAEFDVLQYDPTTRRVLCTQGDGASQDVVLYHPPSSSKRVLPRRHEEGHYWMSRGDVYFQADAKLHREQNNKWVPISDDTFIGKSANDKFWLIRREGQLYLRRFGD